ncbi:Ldh family oxidoreductase [Rhizobium sp. GCM10022189]|uniref:Ldh family oxidoreductase n=1 Tax=Rhizobium sp. GCM10022189 TaxID=3252654 RepID=UPI003609A933
MTSDSRSSTGDLVPLAAIADFCRKVFLAAGADRETADAATRGMLHGTRYGIDSHGVRLLPHYVKGLTEGRLNPRPRLALANSFGAVASLDADNGHGALATYTAMDHATRLAGEFGIGAVAIRNSSHFGPAGAYAIDAADRGFIGFAFCNSDSFVRLHDGAMRFHGTNPIACAVPVRGDNPWLFDMATSAVPYNRVQLYRSLGRQLPEGVASDERGYDTTDPGVADMLAPLGGEFGFKGAGLAGIPEILSAVLTGMKLSFDIAPMPGPDFSTPRGLGAFVIALNPAAFLDVETFDAAMKRYVETLRTSPAREGFKVMAPGDREWAVAAEREKHGVTLDPATVDAFRTLAATYRLVSPA